LSLVDKGCLYTVKVLDREDLNRQLVKSSSCTVIIPEYELTIPAKRGQLTTIEGLIRDTVSDLGADQPLRKIQDEATWKKIEDILTPLRQILPNNGEELEENENVQRKSDESRVVGTVVPFTVKLDDPSGNSFLEFIDSMADPKWSFREYNRTKEQIAELGMAEADEEPPTLLSRTKAADDAMAEAAATQVDPENPNDEIYVFPGVCSSCGQPLDTLMKRVIIPYFKARI
jgi:zinc finger protein